MQTITLNSHAGSDGILHLKVPVASPETEFQIIMMLRPITAKESKLKTLEELGWTPGFFETTYGAWEGELIREQPKEHEQREEWP
ncbi:MAG: hypothetical protein DRQ49_13560 [Gammaproteobacteria bacterium]|nr:MAG: hypothetical protein DRQ41_14615 [Gammaproteobacteria bacterium]RKZ38713.1 MAG: hypothetical protein DRQ49_13560 [Gammaproteobacteria bacterium]